MTPAPPSPAASAATVPSTPAGPTASGAAALRRPRRVRALWLLVVLAVLLVGWSLVEGIGAALVMPAIVSLIAHTYSGERRALAFGIVGGVAGAAVAAGPLIGGWVTTPRGPQSRESISAPSTHRTHRS